MEDFIAKSLGINPLSEKELKTISKIPSRDDYFKSQKGNLNNFYGKKHTDETKKIISEKAKNRKKRSGFKHSEETKKKMSIAAKGRKSPNKNKPSTMLGKKHKDISKEKISKSKIGKKRSQETKQKISETLKKKQKHLCINCNNLFDKINYIRWHGDKCKYGV